MSAAVSTVATNGAAPTINHADSDTSPGFGVTMIGVGMILGANAWWIPMAVCVGIGVLIVLFVCRPWW